MTETRGEQRVATPQVVPETPLTDKLEQHVHANNDRVQGLTQDLQALTTRILGQDASAPDAPETATDAAGTLHAIEEALKKQTRMLNDLREVVTVLLQIG